MVSFSYPEINNGKIPSEWKNKNKIQNCYSEELIGLGRKNKIKGKQSPININTKSVHDCNLLCQMEINYNPIEKCIISKNNQDIIIIDGDENSFIKFNNKQLPLKKIYFHTPSQHLIDGNSSAMEINLYHSLNDEFLPDGEGYNLEEDLEKKSLQDSDEITNNKHNYNIKHNKGVIISILIKGTEFHTSTKTNKFFSQFITNTIFNELNSNETKEIKVGKDWNVNDLIPSKKSFFTYDGSLPMPPCYETYTWIVFEEQVEVLSEYIDIIKKEGNPSGFRDAHPLNGRIVFYNHTVEIKEEPNEEITKADIINNMLAPIRITTDTRSGVEYRLGARKILDSYMGGVNKDYNEHESQLVSINNAWEDLGKRGMQDLNLQEINDLGDKDEEKYIDYVTNMIFNATQYNYIDYYDKYKEFKKNTKLKKLKPDDYSKVLKEISHLNKASYFILKKGDSTKSEFTFQNIKDKFEELIIGGDSVAISDNTISVINIKKYFNNDTYNFNNIEEKLLVFFLLNWKLDNFKNSNYINVLNVIEDKDELYKIHNHILIQLSKIFLDISEREKFIFKFLGEDLTFTLDGEECQRWGSNEVHNEGSLFNLFKKTPVLAKEGYKFDEMDWETKKLARDGILNKSSNDRWVPHNKCRDPGGLKGAPWCYTSDPKVRWNYCMVPDRVGNSKRYLLFVIFILIIIIAIHFVKMIFRHELFSQFIAKLTGANFATNAVLKANQIANNVKSNL